MDDIGPANASEPPIVMIPGASSSIETMRDPLGAKLARHHRVILIDRPGQGWSTRERRSDSTPMIQARMIAEALDHRNVGRAVFVGHSRGGAVLPALALSFPEHVAGLVTISAVTHPWNGDVDWIYRLLTVPVIGPVLAHTIVLPYGLWVLDAALRYVFAPQKPPAHYADMTQVAMVLRPDTFLNNAWDLASLHAALAEQSADYPKIIAPVTLIAGGQDQVVSTDIHSGQFAKSVRGSRLVVLPKSGHMPQVAEASLVQKEIEDLLHRDRSSTLDHARN
jgi:pimeloyl-ACP methyl ester carboxylesterase